MAWVADADFNELSDGDLPAQSGGTGWSAAWVDSGNGTNYDVQGTVTYEGAKAVINSTNANAFTTRVLSSATTSGVVYFAARPGNASSGQIVFTLRNAGGGRANVVFGATGNITAGGNTVLAGYSAGTWYVIRLTFDSDAGTYSAAYSTGAYGTAGTFSADSSSATMGGSGDIDRIGIDKDARTGSDYWDYISPTSPFVEASPVNPSSNLTLLGVG